jgi:hypothetical protein
VREWFGLESEPFPSLGNAIPLKNPLLTVLVLSLCSSSLLAQKTNYDESKVPEYTLPDPLQLADGSQVKDAAAWRVKRRPQIVELFERQMYGRAPGRPPLLAFEVKSEVKVLGGKAIRREIVIRCGNGEKRIELNLLVYSPAGAKSPVPAFVGLNFNGNHSIQPDPEITLSKAWMRNKGGNKNHKATEAARGKSSSRWPVELVIGRGCALATMYYGDIDPDFHDGFKNGVHPLFYKDGQKKPAADEWGSIAAWGWGLSRILDYFETDSRVDAKRVIVVGHSRLGKTSLWAGARDERFAMVVSNDSGCGGAALSRRCFGETVARINKSFPHWFCGNFKAFDNKEGQLPLDQHMLVALVAPRPVLVCSAEGDRWADPKGEFTSARHADAVYRLLGTDGIAAKEMPGTNTLLKSRIGYHVRPGRHDMKVADWKVYLEFADHHGLLSKPQKADKKRTRRR